MKCFKCRSELAKDTKFCSYCGTKIKFQDEFQPIADDISETDPVIGAPLESARSVANKDKKSLGDQVKEKVGKLWSKFTLYEKISTIAITIFSLLCLIAVIAGKTFAGIIAIFAVVLVIISLLMKKQIVKTTKSWLHIVAFILAFVLIVPYVNVFSVSNNNAKKIKWSDIVLSDVAPEPESLFGEIIVNEANYLSVNIYKTSKADYDSYVESCKSNGFTVDVNESGSSFIANTVSGYTVSLYHNKNDSKMHIAINVANEYGNLIWPENKMASMIPKPVSTTGKFYKDDEKGFHVNVSNTTFDEYKAYIKSCGDMGFTIDSADTEKTYFAKNSESYTLSVEYQENNVISISVDVLDYEVTIKVECIENWFFSKYDVDILIDDQKEATHKHGTEADYVLRLKVGKHKITFAESGSSSVNGSTTFDVSSDMEASYKIACYYDKVTVEELIVQRLEQQQSQAVEVDVTKYEVTIKVECVENWIFSKYDVDILIDDQKEATHKHGTEADYVLRLKAGKHKITFAEAGSSSVNGSATFDVSSNMEASYKIACYFDKVTVEDLIAQRLEQQQSQAAEDERKAAESKAAEKAAATMRVLEERLPQEMAKRAAVVAITNYCEAIDVFMPDGNTLDVSKFHSYADTSGNFFDYYIGVKDWGEWIAKDEETWHVEQLQYINCFGNEYRAVCDVRYDGDNYLVSNVVIAFGDLSDPSKSDISEYSEEFVVAPKLIQEDRGHTRLDLYNSWVSNQFSAWDGSHKKLADLIKKNLNDEKSFKHIETTYQIIYSEDQKTKVNDVLKSAKKAERVEIGDLFISTQFSAKNAFNATIKNTAFGIVSFANNSITLIAIE